MEDGDPVADRCFSCMGKEVDVVRRRTKWLVGTFIFIAAAVGFSYHQNNALTVTEYTIRSEKLAALTESFTIVQLSDLHGKRFGANQARLVRKVQRADPDMIAFTGDLVDAKRYEEENALLLMRELMQLAPVYFVTGNHEWSSGRYDGLEPKLIELGVRVMRNSSESIRVGNGELLLLGIDDPNSRREAPAPLVVEQALQEAMQGQEQQHSSFTLLLSHRPELFASYADYRIDLTLAGHAHGGQIRLPFIGGVIAPGQGFNPRYSEGKHVLGESVMLVNRGLGNSIIPQRVFNQPEITVIKLIGAS